MQLAEHPTVKQFQQNQAAGVLPTRPAKLEAARLRGLCQAAGADDVGFVELDRAEIADQRDDIRAAFPHARTLISFVLRMNRENVRSPARSITTRRCASRTGTWEKRISVFRLTVALGSGFSPKSGTWYGLCSAERFGSKGHHDCWWHSGSASLLSRQDRGRQDRGAERESGNA